jgi:predicted  nucleic acid-binding Zn-ribbon protein
VDVQERDGYAEQLSALRDKIAALSRQLAEDEERDKAKGFQIAELEDKLRKHEADSLKNERSLKLEVARAAQVYCTSL